MDAWRLDMPGCRQEENGPFGWVLDREGMQGYWCGLGEYPELPMYLQLLPDFRAVTGSSALARDQKKGPGKTGNAGIPSFVPWRDAG
jgi:hypothetical protein